MNLSEVNFQRQVLHLTKPSQLEFQWHQCCQGVILQVKIWQISLLICTLISENQGLKKSRSASNLRKISGPANLDFFVGLHLEKKARFIPHTMDNGCVIRAKNHETSKVVGFLGMSVGCPDKIHLCWKKCSRVSNHSGACHYEGGYIKYMTWC